MMPGTDWKQIPNLEQVFTVALVPLLFTAIVLLLLVGLVWGSVVGLKRRIKSLEGDVQELAERVKAISRSADRD